MADKKTKPKVSQTNSEILMLGYLCAKDADNLIEKVNILDRFGLPDEAIASICGSAIQSVRNARQRKSKVSEPSK